VRIDLTLADRKAAMYSCSPCDRRWWDLDRRRAGLDDVLAAVPTRRARTA
jgi:hypothetical protein